MLELFRRGIVEPAFWALLLQAIVANLLPFAVQSWRLRRMDRERQKRAWNGLSWAVAILALNAISMIPFEWVTRPRRGFEPGVVALAAGCDWALMVILAAEGVKSLLGWLLLGDSNFRG